MPVLYSYTCPECGMVGERFMKITERDDDVHCVACESLCVRDVGCGGFILKGKCWARDGYAKTFGDDIRLKNGTYDPRED